MTQPVTPDLTNAGMDVTELAVGAKDVIASTAERFTSVIEGLLQHLSLENVLMQIAAVFVSMAIGYVISRRINTLVDRVLPGEDVRGLGAYARRALVALRPEDGVAGGRTEAQHRADGEDEVVDGQTEVEQGDAVGSRRLRDKIGILSLIHI